MKTKIYLSNKELYKELIICKAKGKLSKELTNMFMLIAKGIIKKRFYNDPDDKYDAYQSALLDMCRFYHNFDEDRFDNAFAYITEIGKRAMAKSWNKMHNPYSLDNDQKIISLEGLIL